MQLFFNESTKKNFHLSKEESKHVIKVLRKKEGDLLDFTDGNGNHQIGEVLKVNNEGVLQFGEFDTTPTAVTGGMFLSSSGEYYLSIV